MGEIETTKLSQKLQNIQRKNSDYFEDGEISYGSNVRRQTTGFFRTNSKKKQLLSRETHGELNACKLEIMTAGFGEGQVNSSESLSRAEFDNTMNDLSNLGQSIKQPQNNLIQTVIDEASVHEEEEKKVQNHTKLPKLHSSQTCIPPHIMNSKAVSGNFNRKDSLLKYKIEI